MVKKIKKSLHKLSKKISRKNLIKFTEENIEKILKEQGGIDHIKVLNVGAGGDMEDLLKSKFKYVQSIDIDIKREPDHVIDICDLNQLKKLPFTPQLICVFEVLEHTTNPIAAIDNLYEIMDNGSYVMLSCPFVFHIHDEPYDFFRFTKYGLKHLFKNFSEVEILSRNGWLETILVLFVRLRLEKSLTGKFIGNLFILVYFLLTPITFLLQKKIKSDKMTTGYFLSAKK